MRSTPKNNIMRDLAIVAFSVIIAIVLVKTDALAGVVAAIENMRLFGSFLAGMFFTSVFTTAPAIIILGGLSKAHSIFLIAVMGGLGAVLGDLLIFRFVRSSLGPDFSYLVKKVKSERLTAIFRLKLFHWLIPCLGALVIVSPLPDELGLMMMGLSHMKMRYFIPLSFVLNGAGILIIGLIATSI